MMWKFFKREEKQPFTYPAIEERRTKPNYLGWIVVIASLVLIIGYFFLK